MRLLLDTHAFLWFTGGDPHLSSAARDAISSPDNETWISHASAWEVAIKLSLGKLQLRVPFSDLFPGAIHPNNFKVLPTDFRHYERLLTLPRHHGDPFDRLLIAQSQVERLTIVTRDPEFSAYGVPVLW